MSQTGEAVTPFANMAHLEAFLHRMEKAAFAASPFHDDTVLPREADDLAKLPGKPTDGVDAWIAPLPRVIQLGARMTNGFR